MDNLFNEEYEKVILSNMLQDNTLIDAIKAKVTSKCFHNPKYKLIFDTIVNQYIEDGCSNIVTVASKLDKFSAVEISSLTNASSSTANWEFYASNVRELYTARKMKLELAEMSNKISGNNNSEVINYLNGHLLEYMGSEGTDCMTAQNLCVSLPDKIMKAYKSMKEGQMLLGYSSGYDKLDSILDGFQTEKLYVIGARPSIGKTAFALNLIANICKNKTPTAVFSFEMSTEQLFYRMIAQLSGLQIGHVQKGFCFATQSGMGKFRNGLEQLFEFPLNIYDRGVDTEDDLYAKIRYEAKVNGTKVFVIDHLGLIGASDPMMNRYMQVGNITKTLHKMAKELNVSIILLCQVGRDTEGKEPTLNQLRESGNIEQDADVVMFLHRERDMNELNVPTQVIVAKQRDGRIGKVDMIFQLSLSKFIEAEGFASKDEEQGTCPSLVEEHKEKQSALF